MQGYSNSMQVQTKKWLYLIILSLVWGSSFILIKKGLVGLTSIQVGALRLFFTSIFLLSVGAKSLKQIKRSQWKWVFWTGLLGSGIPPFLFAIAQTEIDSGIASILNSLTPLNTLITGIVMFGILTTKRQIFGVIIGFTGTFILIAAGYGFNSDQNYWYSIFIIIASVGYAINVNMIKRYLNDVGALAISTGNFAILSLPAIIILWFTGFFETILDSKEMQISSLYIIVLSLFGTAIAKVLFNKLVHIASPVFASSVTYTMPLISILWGVLDGEKLNLYQLLGGLIILIGVYLANKTSK